MTQLERIRRAWDEGQNPWSLRGTDRRFRHWLMDSIAGGVAVDGLIEAARQYHPYDY